MPAVETYKRYESRVEELRSGARSHSCLQIGDLAIISAGAAYIGYELAAQPHHGNSTAMILWGGIVGLNLFRAVLEHHTINSMDREAAALIGALASFELQAGHVADEQTAHSVG